MQIKVRDCVQCIVKSWSSAFTHGLTCVIDHLNQSSFASAMSWLHCLQNSALPEREKCQFTGNSLTKPSTLWREKRQWMWRQCPSVLYSQDCALPCLISQTERAREPWLQRIHTPTFAPQTHLLTEEQLALLIQPWMGKSECSSFVLILLGLFLDFGEKYQCRSSIHK